MASHGIYFTCGVLFMIGLHVNMMQTTVANYSYNPNIASLFFKIYGEIICLCLMSKVNLDTKDKDSVV